MFIQIYVSLLLFCICFGIILVVINLSISNNIIDKKNIENHIINILNNENKNFNFSYISNDLNDTNYLANIFGKYLKKGNILNINGELGAGKTAFVKGIANYLNILDQVSSPTFTIVNEYNLKNNERLFHFDVYRLSDCDEFLEGIGTDYFENGICIIEWGNIIKDILPFSTINIDIIKDSFDENKRIFKIWR